MMGFISTYINDWIQAKQKHRQDLAILESRIKPIEDELERWDDKLRAKEAAAPTWQDNVVAPILAGIRNTGLYEVELLRDVTVRQVPVMLVIPGTDEDYPKLVNVLFRLEDKTTGDFFVQVTGYGVNGTVQRVLQSNSSLSTEIILRTIKNVAERV